MTPRLLLALAPIPLTFVVMFFRPAANIEISLVLIVVIINTYIASIGSHVEQLVALLSLIFLFGTIIILEIPTLQITHNSYYAFIVLILLLFGGGIK